MNPTRAPTVLLVDDDPEIAVIVGKALAPNCVVQTAGSLTAARAALTVYQPDVVLLDLRLAQEDGAALVPEIAAQLPLAATVILSASASVERAVELFRAGIDDYVVKPVTPLLLAQRVGRILERHRRARVVIDLPQTADQVADPAFARLSRLPSGAMVELCSLIRRFSQSDLGILVRGETGTGKELVARAIHGLSGRRDRPFVTVNCGAIAPELVEAELFGHAAGAFTGATGNRRGLVREAAGGTLFLDEVGELPLSAQPRLLRLLQEGEVRPVGSDTTHKVDVRVVAATHVDLEAAVDARRFREDLFHRLAVVELSVPPLRDRRSDILIIAEDFLREAAEHHGRRLAGFESRALRAMVAASWPGNVRELQNAVRRGAVIATGPLVRAEDLGISAVEDRRVAVQWPAGALGREFHAGRDEVMSAFEKDYVMAVLAESGGNVAEAARKAGLPRKSFWRIAARNGLDADRASRREGRFAGVNAPPETIGERLGVEREEYRGRTAEVVREIARRLSGTPTLSDWMWVEGAAHQLVGSAGSYGFTSASSAASQLCEAAAALRVQDSRLALGILEGAIAPTGLRSPPS